MGKVAAIQMTSSHVVADNLAAAGALLREAKDLGAQIACLPENFSFIGLKDADKLPVAEADGDVSGHDQCGIVAGSVNDLKEIATDVPRRTILGLNHQSGYRRELPGNQDLLHLCGLFYIQRHFALASHRLKHAQQH